MQMSLTEVESQNAIEDGKQKEGDRYQTTEDRDKEGNS